MNTQPSIRNSVHGDWDAIEALYPDAFPDEDLLPLVRELLNDAGQVVSLVATIDSRIAGHVAFTRSDVSGHDISAALLGPLAVCSPLQRQGIGSALVRAGLERMEKSGVDVVCVLGDPNYYGRFGFERDSSIEPPYPLPPEWGDAWQSLSTRRPAAPVKGRLCLPEMWMHRALWAP